MSHRGKKSETGSKKGDSVDGKQNRNVVLKNKTPIISRMNNDEEEKKTESIDGIM